MTHDINTLREWIKAVTIVAAICTTSVPVLYAFSSWHRSRLGQLFMLQAISFAMAMDLSAVFGIWKPNNVLILFWSYAVVITFVAISTASLAFLMWRMNHPKKKGNAMRFNSKVYDVLKSIAQLWLPSAGTLYFALAQIWHLPSATEVTGTVVALDTFLGVILGISTASYNSSDAKYDGALEITNTDDKRTFALNLDTHPDDLETQKEVVLKVKQQ